MGRELIVAAWAALAEIEPGDRMPRLLAAMDGWEPRPPDDGLRERYRCQATLPLLLGEDWVSTSQAPPRL